MQRSELQHSYSWLPDRLACTGVRELCWSSKSSHLHVRTLNFARKPTNWLLRRHYLASPVRATLPGQLD